MKKICYLSFFLFVFTSYPSIIFSHNPGITVDALDYKPPQKNSYDSSRRCEKNTSKTNISFKIEGKVASCSTKDSLSLFGFYFANGFMHHVNYHKFSQEIHGKPFLMILGGCYEANKRFIKWVSSKEICRVSIFEDITLDLDSLVL